MLLYVGLVTKYSTVGKPLKVKPQDQLKQKVEYDVPLRPFASVVQLNSDYMELIDRWNYDRGYLTILVGGFTALSVFMCYMSFFLFLPSLFDGSLLKEGGLLQIILCYFFGILLVIASPAFLWVTAYIFTRESFAYTYYPTRFNRKLRKVYVLKPNKKLLVANWDDIVFVRQDSTQGQYDLRGHILDEQGIVTDAFCLPYVDTNPYSQDMTGNWEFVRRYMEDPTGAEQAYDATYRLFPISKRKETTKESIERVYLITNNYTDNNEPHIWSRFFFLILLPLMLIVIIGRRISILTSRTPHFPQWVEDECKVDPDDAYNLETHPHPKYIETAKSFKVRVALGALYVVLAIISVYLVAGFIDLVSGMKGHDNGFVRMLEFWNW
jgi:hypothetical protein